MILFVFFSWGWVGRSTIGTLLVKSGEVHCAYSSGKNLFFYIVSQWTFSLWDIFLVWYPYPIFLVVHKLSNIIIYFIGLYQSRLWYFPIIVYWKWKTLPPHLNFSRYLGRFSGAWVSQNLVTGLMLLCNIFVINSNCSAIVNFAILAITCKLYNWCTCCSKMWPALQTWGLLYPPWCVFLSVWLYPSRLSAWVVS